MKSDAFYVCCHHISATQEPVAAAGREFDIDPKEVNSIEDIGEKVS